MGDVFEVKVPQMGEGLRSATVRRVLKSIGEWVDEDCDIVEIETEKATLSVSAPIAGYITNISCEAGEVVDVGKLLVEIGSDKAEIKNVFDAGCGQVRKRDALQGVLRKTTASTDMPQLPDAQVALIQYLRASQSVVIPASFEARLQWDRIDTIKKMIRRYGQSSETPSSLEIIAWATAQAMIVFEKFRYQMTREGQITRHAQYLIGIAVSSSNDTLATPVISIAQSDDLASVQGKVRSALSTKSLNEYPAYHSLAISDMSAFQVYSAQPVVVYPAAATLFVGTPHWTMSSSDEAKRVSKLVLAFDHRLINGVYAAKFLQYIDSSILRLTTELMTQYEGWTGSDVATEKFGT